MLLANVLLYDRLVIPVMTDQPDRDERTYWISKGWDPDLQATRLEDLAELAIRRPWNAARRQAFKNRLEALTAEKNDARIVDSKQLTRQILAQEQVVERLPGVLEPNVIAAYNSAASLKKDFSVADAEDNLSAQAYLLTRRLAVPSLPNPENSLKEAVKLSRDPKFRAKRSDLFDWQENIFHKGYSPQTVVDRIAEMTDAYNKHVEDAFGTVLWRFAFTIFGIGIGFATAGPVGAAATAALSIVQFATLDRKPVIEAGSTRAVAMFHDVETRLGLSLRSESNSVSDRVSEKSE
jgi:hypothetical protein